MGQWSALGPEEIVESIYAGPNSGRATVIAVNPNNPSDVWLGAATGGLWHSTNIDAPDYAWETIPDIPSPPSIGALLLEGCSAQRCATIWVGTGENNIRRDTYYGTGLLKLSWDDDEGVYRLDPVGDTADRFRHGAIIDIKRLEGDLYVAVSKGKSASASTTIVTAPPPQGGYGVHRSSDSGQTWTRVGASPAAALPSDMEVHNGTLLVGFHGQGIFRLAPGDVWCPLGPASSVPAGCPPVSTALPDPGSAVFDHVALAVAARNPDVIYAAFGQCSCSETLWCRTNPDGHASPAFFVSVDGGASWNARTNSQLIETYSRYTHVLEVNPQFEDRVYYGGLDLWASADYGNEFGKVAGANSLHLDQQDLAFPVPSEPLLQYVATDGGFYLRDRRTALTNAEPKNFGLDTVQFYSVCSSDWRGARLLMGGTQDNGTVLFNGSTIWEFVLEGDGGDCNISAEDLYYASLYEISPRRATTVAPNDGDFEVIKEGIDLSEPSLFFPPFVMHPESRVLYFGTNRLYRRGAADTEWAPVSHRFDESPVVWPEIERRNAISAIGLSRSDANVIYVALYNGDLWRSHDTGMCDAASCWSKIAGHGIENGPPPGVPASLDVDPNDPDIVYVAYTGFSESAKVWRSLDGGQTWEPFDEGLPPGLPAKVIKVDPHRRNLIYLGTDEGIFRRNLYGNVRFTDVYPGLALLKHWIGYSPDSGIPKVPVYDIAIDNANDLVYAATHGRGMYVQSPEPLVYVVIILDPMGTRGLYLFGHAFRSGQPTGCALSFIGRDGKRIASTSADARGGSLQVDGQGRLIAVNAQKFGRSQMFAPCLEAKCLDDSGSGEAVELFNVTALGLSCGKQDITTPVTIGGKAVRDPASTLLRVRKLDKAAEGSVRIEPVLIGAEPAKGDTIIPVGRVIEIAATHTGDDIAEQIAKSINSMSRNKKDGFRASVLAKGKKQKQKTQGEVEHRPKAFVGIKNKTIKATKIFTAVSARAGEAKGLALDIESIGRYADSVLHRVRIDFTTGAGGARGGTVTFSQRTPTGVCRVSVETEPGQTAEAIAAGIYRAVMQMPPPGIRSCAARHNSYDLSRNANSIVTSSALGISVEIDDAGVGSAILPFGTGTR